MNQASFSVTMWVFFNPKRVVSSRIFHTYLRQNHKPIITECENLIEPVKKLSEACTYGDHYTFGVLDGKIKNGTAEVSYHLRIAAGGF